MDTNSAHQMSLPPPPIFGIAGGEERAGKNGIIFLDDIFDEFLFSNERQLGRSHTTDKSETAQNSAVKDEVDDDDEDDGDDDSQDGEGFEYEDGKKRKRSRGLQRNMTEEQKVERRY